MADLPSRPVGNGTNDNTVLACAGVKNAATVNNTEIAILVFNSSSSAAGCGSYTSDCDVEFHWGSLRTANAWTKPVLGSADIRDDYAETISVAPARSW